MRALYLFLGLPLVAGTGPQVRTSGGLVEGNALPGANEFLGIPFGAPTKRFEPPEDFKGSYATSPLKATDFGPACMQVGNTADETYGSEDCLTANVWQPAGAKPGDDLPVLVFIYGGSNQFGEAEPYNGSSFAVRQHAVYVSIAYRTGPIGWMAFEEDVAAGRSTGNFGCLDTQSGLRWVQREIRNFGGSPSRVAIHGQSSGAMLVELHLVMPGSKGLLGGLVSESGGLTASPVASGIQTSKAIGELVGCNSSTSLKACLQRVPALKLTSQTYNFGWGPHIDGVTVPQTPITMVEQGAINPISVILGAQTNDTFRDLSKAYIGPDGQLKPLAPAAYMAELTLTVGLKNLPRALELYPAAQDDQVVNVHRLGSASSDQNLCSIRKRASMINKHRPGHVFMYRFNYWYQSNPNCTAEPNYHPAFMGAVHEDEVTFVFGQPIFMFLGSCCGKWGQKLQREPCPQSPSCVDCWDPQLGEGYHAYFNDKEWAFSQLVGGFWREFAGTGSPNKAANRAWPSFPDGGPVTHNIVLDADLPGHFAMEGSLYNRPEICAFWDAIAAQEVVPEETLPIAVEV